MSDHDFKFTITAYEYREIELKVDGAELTQESSRGLLRTGAPRSGGLIPIVYDPNSHDQDPYRNEGATHFRRAWNNVITSEAYSAATFCAGAERELRLRKPDWIEYHPLNPDPAAANLPGNHPRHHLTTAGSPGNPLAAAAVGLFDGFSEAQENFVSLGQGRVYVFGFFEELTFPIQIRVVETSVWRDANRRELNGFAWEAIRIRLGWYEESPGGPAFFLSDPPIETRWQSTQQVNIRRTARVSDQVITITNDNPANPGIGGRVHWLMIEDMTTEQARRGNRVHNLNPAGNRTGADIHLSVCSRPGRGLEIIDIPVYVSLIIDVSGSTLTDANRINRIRQAIDRLRQDGELRPNYFYSIRLLGAVINANGQAREADDVYTEPDPADNTGRVSRAEYKAYGQDRVHNTAVTRILSFEESGALAEANRLDQVANLIDAALNQGERYAYSPIWRALNEAALDIAATGTAPEAVAHAVILFSDGDDTMGGHTGSPGVEILNRRDASMRANNGSLPAPSDASEIHDVNAHVAREIRDDARERLLLADNANANLDPFQSNMRALKYDRNIGESFVITNPNIAADHPLIDWLGGSSVDLEALGNEAAGVLSRGIVVRSRWCHARCRDRR